MLVITYIQSRHHSATVLGMSRGFFIHTLTGRNLNCFFNRFSQSFASVTMHSTKQLPFKDGYHGC